MAVSATLYPDEDAKRMLMESEQATVFGADDGEHGSG
jgi:hypothetical protein